MQYITKTFEQAKQENLAPPWDSVDWDEVEEQCYEGLYLVNGIWLLDDGESAFITSDGGEPEDQTLTRNWSWVSEALNSAYEQGRQDGHEESRHA